MWKITIILNAILMAVFGLGSAASQIKLRNFFVQYPDAGERMLGGREMLPAMSVVALPLQWVYKVVPLLWVLMTLVLLTVYWKNQESARDMAQLHTSITLLVGLVMLGFFVVTGSLPFVQLV